MSNAVALSPVEVTHDFVPTYHGPRINEKIIAVNRKLAKLGAPAATVEFGPVVEIVERDFFGVSHTFRYFETVTVKGSVAKLDGFTAVASLDHTIVHDEAFVSMFPGQLDIEIPESFRFRGPVCDHCGLTRDRNTTVLFLADDGSWIQVGTSCVLEFIGVDPKTVLWLANAQFSLGEDDEDMKLYDRSQYSPAAYLAYAAEAIREVGFKPTTGSAYNVPTRDVTWDLLNGTIKSDELRRRFPTFDGKRGSETAVKVIAWIEGQEINGSDFIRNAKLACRADVVSPRIAGILACLPHVYANEMDKIAAKAAEATKRPSEHVGAVGAKISVEGVVTVVRTFENTFAYNAPPSHLVAVITEAGDRVVTTGSGASLRDVQEGDRVTLTGKVKQHVDGRYGKETKLSHAKIVIHEDVPA